MTSSELESFLAAAQEFKVSVRNFCWMMAVTGCRISEALSMTVNSIDFKAENVVIKSLKKRGKTMFRSIPLPKQLLNYLKKWFKSENFNAGRLWPWSRMTGYRRICEVMGEAGITGSYATPKGLRHGFGVKAIQSNVPLTLVQKWLGHADIKTTAIYTSAMGPEEREIASRMWRRSRKESRRSSSHRKQTDWFPTGRPVPPVALQAASSCEDGASPATSDAAPDHLAAQQPTDIKRFLRTAINSYCPLIQNWIFCLKFERVVRPT
ncbi:MAG TPA: site-specific integrase [Sphingobium sp.]|nr:site-specific integrase [Sphingobium sp.]